MSTVSLNLIGPSGAEREKGVKRKCCGGGGRLRGAKKRDEIEDFSHLQILEQRHFHTPEIKSFKSGQSHGLIFDSCKSGNFRCPKFSMSEIFEGEILTKKCFAVSLTERFVLLNEYRILTG